MLSTDYLNIGAGAVGLAFADQLLTDADATMTIVDRRRTPGGHWNDAYPFVRLHEPSVYDGVGSRALEDHRIDTEGLNKDNYRLATGDGPPLFPRTHARAPSPFRPSGLFPRL